MTFAVYIQDQSHESYEAQPNEVIGWSVQVYRNKKQIDGMWCRTEKQANNMAAEYHKEEQIRKVWNK